MPLFSRSTPAKRIASWFIAAIIIGSVLLSLPISVKAGRLPFVDALFTATSAVCVTGLAVVNTADTFSIFGQIVILILIQLGGLGLMIFSTLFFMMVSGRVSISHRMSVKEIFTPEGGTQLTTILKATFLLTFIVETVGTVLLMIPFSAKMGIGEAFYCAIFHSVSAFCNAGFSILPGGLSEYHNSVTTLLSISLLVIIGGIGFAVVSEVTERLKNRSTRKPFSLHAKIVINATIILLLSGTILFYLLESNSAFAAYSPVMKIVHSFFQSVTTRTAGFDAVNLNMFSNVSIIIMTAFMIIGGSPGSTAGGIKTTSFVIVIATIISRMKGSAGVNIYKRTVGDESVIKAISILILAAIVIFGATILLMMIDNDFLPHSISPGAAIDYFFETVSAFGTVGLSLGITPLLNSAGKLLLVLVMFTGRVGILTVAYMIAKPEGADKLVYSEENVMIG